MPVPYINRSPKKGYFFGWIMKKIIKGCNLIIMIGIFLWQSVTCCIAGMDSALRPPVATEGLIQDIGNVQKIAQLQKLVNDWEHWKDNEENILKLACSLLGIDNIHQFRPARPIKPIIVAGGIGSRAREKGLEGPKVLAKINGKPALIHVVDKILALHIERPLIIVNNETGQLIKSALEDYRDRVDFKVITDPALGWGNGILQTEEALGNFEGDVVIILAVQAVIRPETILKAIIIHQALKDSSMSLVTTVIDNPYSPLVRNDDGRVVNSLETRLGDPAVSRGEANVGLYIVRSEDLFPTLREAHNGLFDKELGRYGEPGQLGFPNVMVPGLVREGKGVFGFAMAANPEFTAIRFDPKKEIEDMEYYLKTLESNL